MPNQLRLRRIQSQSRDLNLVQDAVQNVVQQIGSSPFIGGTTLSNQSVGTGVTKIAHTLGYTPQNVYLGPSNANTVVYMPQAADDSFIYLQAGSACVVSSIWVK